ncbi:MAG: NAD(P)/FAD-dependent oxidoreductase [Tannerella sp.]|jgi:all-trans-retinol 13,14-reductase|nr:NAD(P)/FAD-dependent oxidoreductase [Tannerella sp.]
MAKYDVVIIGSGLGGLQCGYILSKHGLNVCVLEKGEQPGGCLQTFRRGKHTFDTGFHYVGGLDDGQPLHRLFAYFGLMDLPWRRMDEDGFDEVVIDNKSYLFANGYDRFAETLSRQFPHQRQGLKKYADFLHNVSNHIFNSFEKKAEEDFYGTSLFAKSAYDYLASTIDDPLLRNVLSGTSLKMELNPKTLPLYIFAQINSSFIQSAWRLKGGGSQIAGSLTKSIERNGGTVRMKAEVTRLIEAAGRIVAAEVNGALPAVSAAGSTACEPVASKSCAERIEADYFIADTHPAIALSLITESKLIRNIYRKRIHNLENTFGMFTANIALKEDAVPYPNRNIYVYKNADVWRYADYRPEQVNTCALVSFQAPEDGSPCTRNMDILTPMYWPEVEPWAGTTVGRRGNDYQSYKKQKAEACINLVSKHIPGLKDVSYPEDAIEKIYTSTSLSYRDYTGTPCGSAYGLRKNYEQLLTTLLSPRTPEPNLFLTGQNLNLHGVLGVSMTSFFTCAEILGMDTAIREL